MDSFYQAQKISTLELRYGFVTRLLTSAFEAVCDGDF